MAVQSYLSGLGVIISPFPPFTVKTTGAVVSCLVSATPSLICLVWLMGLWTCQEFAEQCVLYIGMLLAKEIILTS